MKADYMASEIERLKSRRVELASKMNMTKDNDEKEDLKMEIESLQKQIDTLEKFWGRKVEAKPLRKN